MPTITTYFPIIHSNIIQPLTSTSPNLYDSCSGQYGEVNKAIKLQVKLAVLAQ
jgi:hypothetical protein